MIKQSKDNRKAWNTISESYQKRYSIKTDKLYWGPLCDSKEVDRLLGKVEGKKILELGSGAGQNSIYLAKKGANTIAFDISEEQLKYGKSIAKKEDVAVTFVQGNYESVKKHFEPNSFDIIISAFALQYCMTVNSLNDVMKQISELLRPSGVLIFSVDHPIRDHGYWDNADNFIIDNYFDRGNKVWRYEFPEDNIVARMTGSYKTVSDYLESVINANLMLNNVLEPEPITKETSNNFATKSRYIDNPKANPFAYEHLKRIPGTLIIKASKNKT